LKSKLNDLEAKKKGIEAEIAGMDQGTEEQIRMIFSNLKEYDKTRNIPECKKAYR